MNIFCHVRLIHNPQISVYYRQQYLLSFAENIVTENVQPTSVSIGWTVPSVTQQQRYRVEYGTDPQTLDQTSATVIGAADITLTDQEYSVDLSGLNISTLYYFQIVITFGDVTIMTEISTFRTLDERKDFAPCVTLFHLINKYYCLQLQVILQRMS